jgi:hypothetical protein
MSLMILANRNTAAATAAITTPMRTFAGGPAPLERFMRSRISLPTARYPNSQRLSARVGNRPHLPLRVGTRALYTNFLNEFLGGQPLDGAVEASHRDVGSQRDVLLLGQQPQLMTVLGSALLPRGQDKQRDR